MTAAGYSVLENELNPQRRGVERPRIIEQITEAALARRPFGERRNTTPPGHPIA